MRFLLSKVRSRSLVAALVLGAFSCGPRVGTDVGNGATVAIDMRGYDKQKTQAPLAINLADGTSIDEFWVVSSRFRLRQAQDGACPSSGADEERIAGPLVADLAGEGFLEGAPSFETEATGYCRLWLDIGDSKSMLPTGSPSELEGASIFVRGKRRDGVAFRITSKLKTDLRIDAKNGEPFELPEGDSQLFVAFALDEVLAASGIDLVPGTGEIVIDAESNKDVLKAFESAFRKAARLFRDRNEDGALGVDESNDEASLANGNQDDGNQ